MRSAVILVVLAVVLWATFVRPDSMPATGVSPSFDQPEPLGHGRASLAEGPPGLPPPLVSTEEDPQYNSPASRVGLEDLPDEEGDDSPPWNEYGRVAGSVVTPEGVSPVDLHLSFGQVEAGPPWFGQGGLIEEDGTFTADLRASTSWKLAISPSCDRTVFEASFSVVPGETVRPPTLQRIDLTELLEVVELRVLNPDLSPARSVWARERLCGWGLTYWPRRFVDGGRIHRTVCRAEHPIRLSAFGLRAQELVLIPGQFEVVMEEGYAARLVLEDPHPLATGWALGATPIRSGRLLPGRYLEFDPTGVLEVSFSEPARYTLEWTLRRKGGRHHRLGQIDGATNHLDVVERGGTQEFLIDLPADFIRAKVQELRKE